MDKHGNGFGSSDISVFLNVFISNSVNIYNMRELTLRLFLSVRNLIQVDIDANVSEFGGVDLQSGLWSFSCIPMS
jgi:hypothetical protein